MRDEAAVNTLLTTSIIGYDLSAVAYGYYGAGEITGYWNMAAEWLDCGLEPQSACQE